MLLRANITHNGLTGTYAYGYWRAKERHKTITSIFVTGPIILKNNIDHVVASNLQILSTTSCIDTKTVIE